MVSKRVFTFEAVYGGLVVRHNLLRRTLGLLVATCCAAPIAPFIPTFMELPGALAYAEPRSEDLKEGDTPGDVLRVWGEPVERVQKSLKGAVVWYYPRGTSVTFEQGRVREWHVERRDMLPTPTDAAGTPGVVTPTVAAVVTTKIKQETRDLLREIAKEVPSNPDSPSSSVDVVVPQPIQQPPPPPPPPPIQQPELLPQVLGQPEPGLVPGQIQPLGVGGGEMMMED
jgi:hypothetical protein